jgi:2-polyprenyl-3-methyl-5-hydroxy-6-metoxy-1,4-benzoquinol methylase
MRKTPAETRIDRVRDANFPATFPAPHPVMPQDEAARVVTGALRRWQQPTKGEAQRVASILMKEFPDQAHPEEFWHSESSGAFRDFFVWGHDHDFGHGCVRAGAMGARHMEITSDAVRLGMLPPTLEGRQVLDVGCWSGGDLLVLAGLGAQVTAVEEHPVAARAARRLLELLGLDARVVETSVYRDDREWAGMFDYAYCSGVVYHVTDPLLLLRILFAYLRPGGDVLIETKAVTGEGSLCSYSGTLEKGWNWYAPNETALGRWLVDAGFDAQTIKVFRRANGRLLACGRKTARRALRETAGFSRPGSWLEGTV